MQKRRVRWATWLGSGAAALALNLLSPPLAASQTPVPEGSQFQVNLGFAGNDQRNPSVAADANGNFVVVWDSDGSVGSDSSFQSVQGQRFASNGSPIGIQFEVNTYTTSRQRYPAVAADADGDFIVVWESRGSSGTDTSQESVHGQRYASDGSTLGGEFQVNTYTAFSQYSSSVAADADGDFVVVWESEFSSGTDAFTFSIQGQRYASNGSTQGAQFQVNTYTTGSQESPFVAMAADGDFIVVWQSDGSFGTDSSGESIQGQRFASSGAPIVGEFQINTYTTSPQRRPSVAVDADGRFVVVWGSSGSPGSDTLGESVQGQRYASDGSVQGGQFQVNTYTTNSQGSAVVAANSDGEFVVVWASQGSFNSNIIGIQGQRFASDGAALGSEFQVNSYTGFSQRLPSVAMGSDDAFVVVWHSSSSPGSDRSGYSIQGQRYRLPSATPSVPAMSSELRFVLAATLVVLGLGCVLRRRGRRARCA